MGGFILELDPIHGSAIINITHHLNITLTTRGVALLAKCGRLPRISKAEIVDKSKADNMTKLLSCLQATWMGIEVANLPITLLEVNASWFFYYLIFSLCIICGIAYTLLELFWW